MIETLMIPGGHRIDYLSVDAAGKPDAIGFYVSGDLTDQMPYSHEAKHHLYAGLDAIRKHLSYENLVAIYVDVDSAGAQERPAYRQMKKDMLAGKFRKLFTFVSFDLLGDPLVNCDLLDLYHKLRGFDWITCDDGICRLIAAADLRRRLAAGRRVCA